VSSQAVVIATGVSADGRREVLRWAVGDSETQDFWTEFLRGLRDRGLGGVQLVISDHHRGLMNAIDATMAGAAWQRCRVHFMRNVLAKVPKGHADMVAAAIRTVFTQPTGPLVREQVEVVAVMLEPQLPAVAVMLRDAKEEITAFADFPEAHWRKVWSTNPLERLNREVKRRTDVVGIFPNPAALLRLSTCVLIEAHDEWQVAERRYLSEASMAQLNPPAPTSSSSTRRAGGGDFYLATCGDFLMATDKPGGPPKAEPGRGAPRSGGALIRKSRVRQLSGGPQTRCRGGRW